MQYRVVSVSAVFSGTKALEKLIREVNAAIAEGWEPLGGISCSETSLFQAMIKRR
jgi:hypothetical protein